MSDSPATSHSRKEPGEEQSSPLTEGMLCPASVSEGLTLPATIAFIPSGEADSGTRPPSAKAALPSIPGYEVLAILGRGGMGIVYKARQIKANRLVALKMVLAGSHAGESELARFRSEAESIARLQHPHIVQLFEVGEHEGQPFFSLEFCSGGSLARQLHGTPLPPREAARLIEVLAEAVQAAHQKGVIHRDLKPANVLLASEEHSPRADSSAAGGCRLPLADCLPKIADFGLAKKVEEAGQTASGIVVGTPSYMAPEQASGLSNPIGPATDIYALGAILYELLTGRPPFRAATPVDTVLQVLHEEPVPPRQLQSRTPRDLETICLKCLHKDPARRYAAAADVAADLRRFLRGEPIEARPVGVIERAAKWIRRRPAAATLLAVAAALPLLALLMAGWYLDRQRQFNADLQDERNAALEQKGLAERNEAEARQRKKEADEQREEADAQKKRAQEATRDSQFRLMQMHVARGVRLMEDGDSFAALPWLVTALKEDPRDEATRAMHRYRIGALLRHSPRLTRMFFHQAGTFNHVEFSADGRKLLTTDDRTVRIWDVAANKEVCAPLQHDGPARIAASFSPDGRQVLTVSGDPKVHVWDADTGKTIRILAFSEGITAACFIPDGRHALVTEGRAARLWDLRTGEAASLRLEHEDQILHASFSRDGRWIVTTSKDGALGVWNVTTGQLITPALLRTATIPTSIVRFKHAALSPDGKHLATTSGDGRLCLWQLGLGTGGNSVRLVWKTDNAAAVEAHYNRDGSRVVSWGYIRAKLWDAKTGQLISQLEHNGQIGHSAFSPDGRWIVTASEDLTARVWNAATGDLAIPPLKHAYVVYKAAFSADGRLLATACADGAVRVWDLDSVKPGASWSNPGQLQDLSPDTRYAVSLGERDQEVLVLDSGTGKPVRPAWHLPAKVGYAAFSPDSGLVVVVCADRTVRMLDIASGEEQGAPIKHDSDVLFAVINADATRLATGCKDGTVHVWDVSSRKEVYAPLRHAGPIQTIQFSGDGRLLLTSGKDSKARVWDTVTGQPVGPYVKHETTGNGLAQLKNVGGPAWSSDGKQLGTAWAGFSARAVDATTGQLVGPQLDHSGGLVSLVFRPDGGCLLSTSNDCTALQWDVTTGRRLTPPMRHRDFLRDGTYSPDGRLIATTDDKVARIWDAATGLPLSPFLTSVQGGNRVRFSPDGHRLFRWYHNQWHMNVWDMPRENRPAKDLVKLTDLLSGHHLDDNGGMIPLTRDELRSLWQDLSEESPEGLGARLSKNERIAGRLRQALQSEINRQWDHAIDHYDKAIALDPEKADAVWPKRAYAFAQLQQWDKAIADLIRFRDRHPDNHYVWFQLCPLLLRVGDAERHRRHCQEMLQRFGQTRNQGIAEHIAKGCLLHSGAAEEIDHAADLMAWAICESEKHPLRDYFKVTMGLAEYRQGQFLAAEQRLDKFLQAGGKLDWSIVVPGYLVLAMAQQRQGHSEKARATWEQATTLMKQQIPQLANANGNWLDWLVCQLLREEAEDLLNEKR